MQPIVYSTTLHDLADGLSTQEVQELQVQELQYLHSYITKQEDESMYIVIAS